MIAHETWLGVAKQISNDSKCVSMKVGCVLVHDGHVISTGVNGTPSGYTNCCDKFKERCPEHHEWSLKHEIHAELNSIIHRKGSLKKGTIAYVTHSPCFNCLKHLAASFVSEIHFIELYYRMTNAELQEIVDFCIEMNIKLVHYPDYV
jgi:dCMP deaminase|tara:strand:+ start:266 stop:709 length:444 start_codon:yes stop_codon:yes gene_type:complete